MKRLTIALCVGLLVAGLGATSIASAANPPAAGHSLKQCKKEAVRLAIKRSERKTFIKNCRAGR